MGAKVLSGGAPMKRILIPDAENYLTAIQDELGRTRDIHYFHRLEVLRYVLQGHKPYQAAQVFSCRYRYGISLCQGHVRPGDLDQGK